MTSGSVNLDPRVGGAAGTDDGLQIGRLGGDTAKERRIRRGDVSADADAALLLVDERREFDGPAQPGALKCCHRRKAGCQAAFHIGGAAAVDAAVVDGGAERVLRPALADGDDVGVAEQQKTRSLAAAEA